MAKSQINSQSESQIIWWQKYLNYHAKSQIISHEMKSNKNHLNPNHKSNHDVNQMKTVPDSIVYVWNVINVRLAWLSNVSLKISDGTITEINSLTQLQ